jgi:hypothetical protein
MGVVMRTARVFAFGERLRACVALAFVSLGCTTTLDPTIVAGEGNGGTGSGDEPLAQCDTVAWEDSELLICAQLLAFAAAAHDCELRKSSLVAIRSAEEQDFVTLSAPDPAGDTWLGGTRNGGFVWSWPDGSVFWRGGPDGTAEDGAFTAWKGGEPNNASTTSSDPERCLAVDALSGGWNDRACELTLQYVCERPRETR